MPGSSIELIKTYAEKHCAFVNLPFGVEKADKCIILVRVLRKELRKKSVGMYSVLRNWRMANFERRRVDPQTRNSCAI